MSSLDIANLAGYNTNVRTTDKRPTKSNNDPTLFHSRAGLLEPELSVTGTVPVSTATAFGTVSLGQFILEPLTAALSLPHFLR